ncbi:MULTISPECIES: hypothetical protein [unclassified Rathayibacter]|uniref:hypothetical protein n=1 Tax=unclassified Rathayibacter TaxID=2609250 RepID=UPI0006F1E21E|nr:MULTISPECIES: hypothetical protein [unclassified Rathayibacter]KQP97596.1 hypothetical protein ASF42_18150 [Rathayibacter sp. Leaf294]KQS07268.1 hypothetical protein ASG06_18885 [Rathayibacter sp. Leaf185]
MTRPTPRAPLTAPGAPFTALRAPFWQRLLLELAPLLVVSALALVVLARMAQSEWSAILLYSGDSLVLPLLHESLVAGEPFDWVFSSQLFFFPELVIYSAIALFISDPRAVILVNAVVNLLLFYAFARVIARVALQRTRHRFIEISVSLGAIVLFVVICLLEPQPNINGSSVASLYLFNTYYQGVVIIGLAVLALTLWLTRAFRRARWGSVRTIVYAVVTAAVTAAVTLCDPLYLLQVTAPLALTLIVMWFARHLTTRGVALLLAVNVVSALVGLWGRRFVEQHLAIALDKYMDIEKIPSSITLLGTTLTELSSTSVGMFKLLLWGGAVVVTTGFFLYALFAQTRPALRRTVSGGELFLTGFSTLSFLTMVLGFFVTGSQTTRYLLPIFVFPLLAMIPVVIHVLRLSMLVVPYAEYRRSLARFMIGASSAVAVLIVAAGAVSTPPVVRMATGADYSGADCFESAIGDREDSGVGSFWITRQWELYADERGDVLQVEGDLTVMDWMINLSTYLDKDYSYVVVDPWGLVTEKSVEVLGTPASVTACGDFDIYDYEGTPGEQILTDAVDRSAEEKLALHGME